MNEDCIFCKIVAGEIPSSKVYEDADTIAFLDISPITKGHTLVIPKEHHDPLMATPADVLAKLIEVVKQVAVAQSGALDADGINVTQANGSLAGQVVPHIHFHVIPRFGGDEHSWTCPQKEYDSREEAGQFASRIRDGIANAGGGG
jgi:histidine triad (HIT) family protein